MTTSSKKTIRFGLLLITIMIIIFGYQNTTEALINNDCGISKISSSTLLKRGPKREIDFTNIYPLDSINRAIINLKDYCCNANLIDDPKGCKENKKEVLDQKGPDSPFLYDHLIDIGLRRLDGIKGIVYDLDDKLDPTGTARRESITKQAESTGGIVPSAVTDNYKKYWTLHADSMFRQIHLNIDKFDTNDLDKLTKYTTKYNDVTQVSLADKYNNICRIARNIYDNKAGDKVFLGGDTASKDRSFYTDCQKMVARRMNQENLYVKVILIQKANQKLTENLDNLMNKTFVQDRLMKLQEKIGEIKDLLTIITRQAPVCKKCQK